VAIHVADPAEAAALRGNKRRAKTDRLDARRLREILENGQIPESWIPPAFVLEVRTKARLYKDLLDLKAAWQHRIHATMFHQGVPKATGGLLRKGRAQAGRDDTALSPAGRQAIDVALTLIAALDAQLVELRAELVAFGRSHPGPIALSHEYGLGPLLATIVWEEMGDTRRFSASRHAVRHTGLDISVYSSDGKRLRRPRVTQQGPPLLRWALFEAAVHAKQADQPRSRLLPGAGRADRPRPDDPGPQTRPPLSPPPARPRGPGLHRNHHRRSRITTTCLLVTANRVPAHHRGAAKDVRLQLRTGIACRPRAGQPR
jgi:transposase